MLVSIYIESHPFLFKGKPQTINLGGRYLYGYQKVAKSINISHKVNDKYIEGFFNISKGSTVKINLATAIVGENGVGKSSILKGIADIIGEKDKYLVFNLIQFKYILIFEKEGRALYHTNIKDVEILSENSNMSLQKIEKQLNDFKAIYYSPHFDITNLSSLNEDDISLTRTFFNDNFSSTTDSISDIRYQLLKLQYNNWKRYVQFVKSDVFNRSFFQDILPDISSEFGHIDFNFKTQYYPQNIPGVHRKWVGDLINRIGFLIDETKKSNENFLKEDYLNNQKKILKLKFLRALISNMVYHIGVPKSRVEGDVSDTPSTDFEVVNGLQFLEYFLDHFLIDEKKVYPGSKYLDFKNLIFKVIDSYYTQKSNYLEYLRDNILVDEFRVPYEEISKIQEAQLDIFSELNSLHGQMDYEKTNTNAEFLVLFSLKREMSSGEIAFLNIFSNLLSYTSNFIEVDGRRFLAAQYVLLIDEGDLGFHPQWKKKYINILLQCLPYLFEQSSKEVKLQLIITTHDPLTLSDFPSSNVVFIKREGILDQDDNERIQNTFGANISELLSSSFFINDGLMGDFAKSKINEVIYWINSVKENNSLNGTARDKTITELAHQKSVINLIDETVLKIKLTEMISELEDSDNYYDDQLQREIDRLTKLKRKPKI